MLPKNDSEYIKNVIMASLVISGLCFVVLLFLYDLLSGRILLTFILAAIISCALFLKDLTRKAIYQIRLGIVKLMDLLNL